MVARVSGVSRSRVAARITRHQVRYAIGGRPTRVVNRRARVGRETPASSARRSLLHGAAGFECSARRAAAATGSPSTRGQAPLGASHVDHVGWNTVDADGQWVPAFPNAQYLIPAADDFHYGPDNAYGNGAQEVDRLIYEDSVAPIHRAGRAVLWDGPHRIDEHLTLESAPGHTPGSSVLRLASGSDRAVFVGDLLHSPVQILDPCCNSNACLAPEQAVASRRRILGRAADERELLVPAHFGGAGALEVRRDSDRFALGPWATAGRKRSASAFE